MADLPGRVANHTDPKPWAVCREAGCQALVGAHVGRVSSREISEIGVPTPSHERKATPRVSSSRQTSLGPTRSETPRMHGNTSAENRESSCLPSADGAVGCIGKSE